MIRTVTHESRSLRLCVCLASLCSQCNHRWSLLARAGRDVGLPLKKNLCYDFVQGVFPMRRESHTLFRTWCRCEFASRKNVKIAHNWWRGNFRTLFGGRNVFHLAFSEGLLCRCPNVCNMFRKLLALISRGSMWVELRAIIFQCRQWVDWRILWCSMRLCLW